MNNVFSFFHQSPAFCHCDVHRDDSARNIGNFCITDCSLIKDAENSNSISSADGYNWLLGPNSRTRGSVHKDILELTGAELAQAENIAVYSVTGWWKKAKLASDTFSRFSLIESIDAGETDINLYDEIKNQIQIPILLQNGL